MQDEAEEINSIEDALITLHETALNPEIAAPLIRKNLERGLVNEYTFRFYKSAEHGVVCEAEVTTCAKPKFLGKYTHLE